MATNELKSLKNVFDGKYLRIPDYQRGYAWEYNQLKDFWEDLENLENDKTHYMGVLTLEKVTQEKKEEKIEYWKIDYGAYKSDNVFYIVDGQQRITTSIILISVILNNIKETQQIKDKTLWFSDEEYNDLYKKYIAKSNQNGEYLYYFGYTTDNPSYEFLKTKIFENQSISNTNNETLYTANLENAKKFFKEKINNFTLKQKENLFKKITEQLLFNVYEISNDLDVFIAFETMNNRGKKLSNLELLKNRLIYLSTKFEDEDKFSLRRKINECWKKIYEYLGKNKLQPLNDDVFLKNHWIMYFKYSREKGNDYIVSLLEEIFVCKRILGKNIDNPLTIKEINDYILSLSTSIEHWYYLFNPEQSNYTEEVKTLLDKLNRLGYRSFAPLLMAVFSKNNTFNNDEICDLLKMIEKFIFLIFEISKRRSNTGDSTFYNYANQYYHNDKSNISIKDIIGVYDLKNDEYSGINWWLVSYVDIEQFYIYLKDKFKNKDGYYSWTGLSYFLFEYELSLQHKSKNNTIKINWKEYINSKKDYHSIEHILPQTPTDDYWVDKLKQVNSNDYKYIINSLGNLIPLSKAKNSKLNNKNFYIKKNGEDREFIGYKNGSYSEQEINEKEEWGIEEINERTNKLIEFLINHWEIDKYCSINNIRNKLNFIKTIK
ncbi:DUF262 domain-containing protein [Campylobacter sp. GB48]|uniref:DUF262 domain-containing protein n=1 Tax=Campylobacter sp. GB48 TaxID=3400423 RepID=UPI003B9BF922